MAASLPPTATLTQLLLHLPNIPKEKHQFFERNKPVVTSRIKAGFLTEKREACVHIPKIFNPCLGVTLAKQLFDFPAIGKVELVHRGVFGLVGVRQCVHSVVLSVVQILAFTFSARHRLSWFVPNTIDPTRAAGNIHCDPCKIPSTSPQILYKLLFLTKHPFPHGTYYLQSEDPRRP